MTNTLKGTALLSLLILVGFGCVPNSTTQTDTMTNDDNTSTDMMQKDTNSEAMMEGDVSLEGDMIDGSMDTAGGTMPAGQEMPDDENMVGGDAMKDDGGAMREEDGMIVDGVNLSMKGEYVAYAPHKVSQFQNADVVLFFHASWCPTCKALDSDITSHLSDIPSNLVILKTDYDKETELKKRYGVTYQHTLVQVDAKGNMIKKWSGGNTLESVVSQVQ